jgi:Secretion system C-terminal sorting domain
MALGMHSAKAQDGKFVWAQPIGQSTTHLSEIYHNENGLVYGYGHFSGTQVIGGLSLSSAAGAGFCAKLTGETGRIDAVVQNPLFGFQVAPEQFIQFSPSNSGANFQVRKVNLAGKATWTGTFTASGSGDMNLAGAVEDAKGNVYLLAYVRGTTVRYANATINNTLTSSAALNGVYLIKLDPNGYYSWHEELAKTVGSSGISLTIMSGGDVLAMCESNEDIIIKRVSGDRKVLWTSSIVHTDALEGIKITATRANNIYIGGRFANTIKFTSYVSQSSLQSTAKSYDCFVAKLNVDGKIAWAKNFGGSMEDHLNDFVVSDFGGAEIVRCVGQFRESAAFGSETLSDGLSGVVGAPAFFCEITGDGAFQHAKAVNSSAKGANIVSFNQIAIDDEHNVYIAGRTSGEASFGGELRVGSKNIVAEYSFLCKYTFESVTTDTEEADDDAVAAEPVKIAPNPSNGQFNVLLPDSMAGATDLQLDIFAPDGRLVYSQPYEQEVVTDLQTGLYFVRLRSTEKALYQGKLMIRR